MAETPGTGPVIGGVTVEVRAPIDKLSQDFAAAEARTRQADAAISGAMRGTSAEAQELARAQLALIEAFNKGGTASAELVKAVGGAAAAQALLADSAKSAAAAQAVLAGAEQAQARAATEAAAANAAEAVATQASTKAATGHAMATSTVTREIVVMGREIARGNFSRLAGSATILAQAFGALAPETILLTGAVAGTVAVFAVAAAAAISYKDAVVQLTAVSLGAGNQAQATGKELEASAEKANLASGITVGAARSAAEAFAQAGVQSAGVIQELTGDVEGYAELTGVKATDATKLLARAMEDPAKGAAALQEQLGFLDEAELKRIQTLSDLGDKTRAQAEITNRLTAFENDAATAAGGLTGYFSGLAGEASTVWTWLGKVNDQLHIMQSALSALGLAPFPGAGPEGNEDAQRAQQRVHELNRFETAGGAAADDLDPTTARRTALQAKVNALNAGIIAAATFGDAKEVIRQTEALQTYVRALGSVRTAEEQRHALALLEIEDAKAKTPQQKAEVAYKRTLVQANGELISSEDLAQRASDSAAVAASKKTGHARAHRDAVAEETTKIEANTQALLAEAGAYLRADAAGAMRAEADKQARDYAATHPKANIARLTDLFLGQDVAQAAATGARLVEKLNEDTAALHALNEEVLTGNLRGEDESRRLAQEAQLRPLVAAAANAEGDAKAKLLATIEALRKVQAQENVELARQRTLEEVDRSVQAALDKGDAAAEFVRKQTDAVEAEIKAVQAKVAVYGMSDQAAASYLEYQKLLDEATREGRTLTEAQTQALKKLADQYGAASTAAKDYEEAQKGAAEATSTFEKGLQGSLDEAIFGDRKGGLGQIARAFGRSQLKEAFDSLMTGEGGYAGILGTSRTGGPGQPNHGLLSQIIGPAFGMGAAKPDGSPTNPLHVVMAGGGGQGGLGGLASLLGGGGGDGGSLDKLKSLGGVSGANGGFLGKLLGMLGMGGGGGGAAGLFSSIGQIAAMFFHDGTDSVGMGAGPSRYVSPRLFINAPRLHDGLAADEFPAILQQGEEVTPRGARRGGGVSQVNINLKGANGDASIRRIAAQGVARGMQLVRHAAPGDRMHYNLLEG